MEIVQPSPREDGSLTILPYTADRIEIKSLNADVTRDKEGRISAIRADAAFVVIDTQGKEHSLEITMDFTATDYGMTRVSNVYDPSEYGLVSLDEYMAATEEPTGETDDFDWDAFVNDAPDTIEFMGKTFETKMAAWMCFEDAHDHLGELDNALEARARYHGSRVGVKYGEPFRQSFYLLDTIHTAEELFR